MAAVLVDTLAVRLRPRTPNEAIDLGVRLCQSAAPSVYRCYLFAGLPVIALALASIEVIGWWATIVIWWLKPWLDRTILFVLSRAAFGQDTTIGDLWRAQWRVWWRPLLFTLTVRRMSMWRSRSPRSRLRRGCRRSCCFARSRGSIARSCSCCRARHSARAPGPRTCGANSVRSGGAFCCSR